MSVITKSSVFAAVFLGMFVASARAEEIITVNVPFPFVVDHKTLPAGQYDFRPGDDGADVIWIEGTNNRAAVVSFTIRADGRDPAGAQPALVFTRSESEYHLSQIWESSGRGRELPGLPGARRVGRAEAQPGPSDTLVYVLAANAK